MLPQAKRIVHQSSKFLVLEEQSEEDELADDDLFLNYQAQSQDSEADHIVIDTAFPKPDKYEVQSNEIMVDEIEGPNGWKPSLTDLEEYKASKLISDIPLEQQPTNELVGSPETIEARLNCVIWSTEELFRSLRICNSESIGTVPRQESDESPLAVLPPLEELDEVDQHCNLDLQFFKVCNHS